MIISLNVNDAVKDRVINALVANYDYQTTIDDKPNPETKNAFCKRMLIEFVKNHVKAYETKVEQEKISVPTEITIT